MMICTRCEDRIREPEYVKVRQGQEILFICKDCVMGMLSANDTERLLDGLAPPATHGLQEMLDDLMNQRIDFSDVGGGIVRVGDLSYMWEEEWE